MSVLLDRDLRFVDDFEPMKSMPTESSNEHVLCVYICVFRAICSVEQEVLPDGRRFVMLATAGGVYITVGGPGLQGVFSK